MDRVETYIFLEVQENDWYHVEIGGFSLNKVTCFAKLFHEFRLCTSCVPYLAWRIACTGQQATRTNPLVHTSLTSCVLMLVVQLMGL